MSIDMHLDGTCKGNGKRGCHEQIWRWSLLRSPCPYNHQSNMPKYLTTLESFNFKYCYCTPSMSIGAPISSPLQPSVTYTPNI
uniref:Uncharacterized protein n=1 Tax=Arion vulgaris TaxID=1028688 RepID=A0A0B6YPW6_9EUPU